MARRKIFTDKLQDIASFDEKRRANASSLPNNLSKQGVNNSVTYNARRNNYINASANKQSNLKSEKELLHEKFYGKDGRVEGFYNLKTQKIFGDENIIIELSAAPPPPPSIMSYNYNIDFDLTNVTITSFDPEGNENDRPRINTFREDGEFIIYLSAGGSYRYSNGTISLPPWGDRTTGSFSTSITSIDGIAGTTPEALSAGVDVFAGDTMTVYLTPLSTNWFITDTNPGEKKYQLLHNTGGDYDIGVKIIPPCIFILEPTFFGMASITPKVGPTAGGPTLTGENIFNIYQAIGTGTGYANSPALEGGITFNTIPCIKTLFIRVVGRADTYGSGFDTLTINVDGVQKEFFQSVNTDPFNYPLANTISYDEIVNLSPHINDDNSHTITLSGKSGTIANNNVGYDVKISQFLEDVETITQAFSLSSNKTSVNEGDQFTIQLSTTGIEDNTLTPYTVTGIDAGDISESLTGNFTISGGLATATFNVSADNITEGSDTFTLTLDGRSISTSVTINDTSVETFSLSSNKTSVNEGDSFTILLSSVGVTDGTLVPYTITGVTSADITDRGGSITVTGASDSTHNATYTYYAKHDNWRNLPADALTNRRYDYFAIDPDGRWRFKYNDALSSIFSVNSNVSILDADWSGTFIDTEGWTITTSSDYSDITALTGNFTVNNNTDTKSFTAVEDDINEGTQTFTLTLDGKATSTSVTINDTSVETFTLSAPTSVNEGNTFQVTLSTDGVAEGTSIPFTIGGDVSVSDYAQGHSTFTILGDGTALVGFNATRDFITEGSETFTLNLDNGKASVDVIFNDTSVETFTLSSNKTSVNEGESFTIALSTKGISDGTFLTYSIIGIQDSDILESRLGAFVVTNNFAISTFNVVNDFTSETTETFNLGLDGKFTSIDVDIIDTSVATYTLSGNKTSVNEGDTFTIQLSTQGISDGVLVPYTITGIQNEDISQSLNGNFIVSNNVALSTFNVVNDLTTEGPETFTLTLDGRSVSFNVTINDTSQTISQSDDKSSFIYINDSFEDMFN